MDQCEKFENSEWKSIASLPQAITKVGAAQHKENVYISGWPVDRVFCYSIGNGFSTLSFTLPAPFNSAHAVIGNDLYVMRGAANGSTLTKINLLTMEDEHCGDIPNTGMWSSTPAVVYENEAYIANWAWEDFYLEKLSNDTVKSTGISLKADGNA